MRRRLRHFERFQHLIEDRLHISSGDCHAVVHPEYMSEEENDAVNAHGLATSLVKLCPSWRSTKAS